MAAFYGASRFSWRRDSSCPACLAYLATTRGSEQWASYSRIFVTQKGFPYGEIDSGRMNPSSLAANAILYANFANSDQVRRLTYGGARQFGSVEAAAVTVSQSSTDALPMVSLAGLANSPVRLSGSRSTQRVR